MTLPLSGEAACSTLLLCFDLAERRGSQFRHKSDIVASEMLVADIPAGRCCAISRRLTMIPVSCSVLRDLAQA
jgi:hypothetical protein